jgi:oligopeptide transport system permease protein
VSTPRPAALALRRLFANRAAAVSIVVLTLLAIAALAAPQLTPWALDQIDWNNIAATPAFAHQHWFGTDNAGRDLFTRTVVGARVSLTVGVLATAVSVVIGVPWGAIAGFAGGRIDGLMMRVVDVLYCMPFLFLVIVLVVLFGRNIYFIFLALGAVSWLDLARIVRAQTLVLKQRPFIELARAGGLPVWRILFLHIVPNLIGPVIVFATLTVPGAMLAESFISFLGLGVQEPLTSFGVLIAEGTQEMETAPWMLIFPALFLATTLISFSFLGDGLRDAFDPASDVTTTA